MKLKEFDILLDIKRSKKAEEFEVVQNDFETNILNITVVDGLETFPLSGLDIEIAFAKPDGTTVLQDLNNGVEIIGDKVVCTLKTNTIAAPGRVQAEVRFLEGTKLLTSARFIFFVRKSIVNDDTVESTNEFPILNQLINTTQDLIEQVGKIEQQVPENVVTQLNEVSDLANQLQTDLDAHKAESETKFNNINFIPRTTTQSKLPNDYPIGKTVEWGEKGLFDIKVSGSVYCTVLTYKPYVDNSVPPRQIAYIHDIGSFEGKTLTRSATPSVENNSWRMWKVIITDTPIPWINATLQNGWTGSIQYAKDDLGLVTVKGDLTVGTITADTIICTLPDGYGTKMRMPIPVQIIVTASGAFGLYASEFGNHIRVSGNNGLTTGQNIRFMITYNVN